MKKPICYNCHLPIKKVFEMEIETGMPDYLPLIFNVCQNCKKIAVYDYDKKKFKVATSSEIKKIQIMYDEQKLRFYN